MSPEASEQYFFFGCLLAGCAAVMAAFFVVVVRKKRALRSWHAAKAKVVESEVVWGSVGKGRKWLPRFAYEYEVDGRAYTGRRTDFFKRRTGSSAQELVGRHPVGSRVQIFYDPERPAESVLNRDLRGSVWLLFFAFVFGALAVVFFKLPDALGR